MPKEGLMIKYSKMLLIAVFKNFLLVHWCTACRVGVKVCHLLPWCFPYIHVHCIYLQWYNFLFFILIFRLCNLRQCLLADCFRRFLPMVNDNS